MRTAAALLSCLACLTAAPRLSAQELSATGEDCSQNGMACRYWVPEGYDSGQKYPLVIYLHGAGQRGSDNKGHVDDWADLLKAVLSPENRLKFPAFVMAPQCPGTGDAKWVDWPWENGSYDINNVAESPALKETRSMLVALQGKHAVDPDRIYVIGFSMGGFGTWDMISRTPELFAAGAPTDGGGSPQAATKLQNMAVWSFHNADDGSVPVSSDREMFAALAAAGSRPIYTEGAGGGHSANGRAAGDPAFFNWLFAQRRGVPGAPSERLAFSPEGGHFNAATSLTVLADPGIASVKYTLDLTLPSSATGMPYTAPVKIEHSAIVTAVSTTVDDDTGEVNVFHAAPFQIGDGALPGGAVLVPSGPAPAPVPIPTGPGGSGGSASSGLGGNAALPTTPGSAGAGPAPTPGVGGASSSAGPMGAGSGSADSACSVSGTSPFSGHGVPSLVVMATMLAARRRRRARHPRC